MSDPHLLELNRAETADDVARTIRHACEPLPKLGQIEAFGAFFDRLADARVVPLGEATHGSSEFYRARAAITQRLIERHGFSIARRLFPAQLNRSGAQISRSHRPGRRQDGEKTLRLPDAPGRPTRRGMGW